MSRPAIFLDRDGVLNVLKPRAYVTTPAELVLLPGVEAAVRRLNGLGWPVIVATNQQGVGLGLFTSDALDAVHADLRARLAERGAHLTDLYCCPHRAVDQCDCRKPRPGLLRRAAADHDIDLSASWLVGDMPTDAGAARAAGLGGFCLVLTGATDRAQAADPTLFPVPPDHVADDLTAAAAFLTERRETA